MEMVLARGWQRRYTRSQAVRISTCWCVVYPWYSALLGRSLEASIATGSIAVAGTTVQIRAQGQTTVHPSVESQIGV